MARIVTLATFVVIGALMAWLPSAQSFNFGRIIIHSPIVLRSPAAGPLEARQRTVSSPAVTARARQLMSSVLRRLTFPVAQNDAGAGSASLGRTVPEKAVTPRTDRRSVPLLPLLRPVPAEALPSPMLAAGPAVPPPSDSEVAEQPADAPSPAPSATPSPQVVSSPGADPARPANAGASTGGRGRGGKGGRGGGNKISGGDLGDDDDGSGE